MTEQRKPQEQGQERVAKVKPEEQECVINAKEKGEISDADLEKVAGGGRRTAKKRALY